MKAIYDLCQSNVAHSCPVDNYVFPGLDRLREGDSLEARFNAFKIPESNFLVFEATVRTCRDGCQPAFCSSGTGRSEPSYGRRRRSITAESEIESQSNSTKSNDTETVKSPGNGNGTDAQVKDASENQEEFVREMIEAGHHFSHFSFYPYYYVRRGTIDD
jgi:hypothetical protein